MAFSCVRSKAKDKIHRNSTLEKYFQNLPSKDDIQLNNFDLNDQDLEILIKKLLKTSSMKSLSLANNNLTANGIERLLNSLKKHSKLTHLIFSSNPIGDQSIESICQFLKFSPNLHQLSLSNTQITDYGMKILCQTLNSNAISLRSIDLRSNPLITDQSLEDLFKISENNSNISTCRLDNCGFSQDGKDKLKEIKQIKW